MRPWTIHVVLRILLITFPFFALVLCGYVAARRGWLSHQAIPGLNTFVLYFALPCMLYRFGSSTPINQLLNASLIGVYMLCAVLMVALAVAVTRLWLQPQKNWNDASFGALVAAFPNTGFMGVPLLVALLGAKAAGPAIVSISVDMILTSSLCIALSRLDGAGTLGVSAAARMALKGVVNNPLPWAIASGGLASMADFALPKPIMNTVTLLADAASPVALFTIGAVLARSQTNSKERMPFKDYVPVVLIKLLVHPVLLGLLGLARIAMGLPLDRFALTVVVLVAALPSASNTVMLSERFGADSGRIARIILLSTVLAFFSFSGAVALLT